MEILILTLLILLCICLAFGCPLKIQITHSYPNTKEPIPTMKENEELPVTNMDDVIKNLNEAMEVFADE